MTSEDLRLTADEYADYIVSQAPDPTPEQIAILRILLAPAASCEEKAA